MHKAFKTHVGEDRPRSLWQYITAPSRRELREAEDVMGRAKAFKEWSGMPYNKVFVQWLEDEAARPVQGTAHMDLLVGTTRANTFKEILARLRELHRKAEVALGDE